MSSSIEKQQQKPGPTRAATSTQLPKLARIAVGVDGFPEGEDAAALGAALSRATGAELMLVTVQVDPLVPLPSGLNWSSLRKHSEKMLREVRDSHADGARIAVEHDYSVALGLHRAVQEHKRDLLVVGSSREAPEGHVRIGKRTRQLLYNFECGLAIAPRGLHKRSEVGLEKIGVGYDGGPEADAAFALAASIANAAGAELRVCGVVDDRVPLLMRSPLGATVAAEWQEVIAEEEQQLRQQILSMGENTGATVSADVSRGRPANALLALSEKVDLLVIGSRRWGLMARVLLGSTGEALMHDAACPVLTVPRPAT